ncbi:MAG TPA: hypothetical protein VFI73_14775 [Candidatus Nitrosopolaris sp.]|nr:hypothetical protein [Candidatus Nitrosopolaris sp.]
MPVHDVVRFKRFTKIGVNDAEDTSNRGRGIIPVELTGEKQV